MAQNFVGSNNINLLAPCGQFGTRLMGGKDSASPRYIFTKLEKITRFIFHPLDDPLLDYLDDDGQSIEPSFYVPVIPMVLVNGSEGIGTGWSTSITTYNPRDIIANLREMIAGNHPKEMEPWYRGFRGEIIAKAGNGNASTTYSVSGIVEHVNDSTIIITELPISKWTCDYKQQLESYMIGTTPKEANKEDGPTITPFIKDFKENHTDTTVLFTVTLPNDKLEEVINDKGGLKKKFKLETTVSTSNMHMFDNNGVIKKFDGPLDILYAFYSIRINYYSKRKNFLLNKLTEDWEKLDNKVNFILAVINNKIIVSNRKKSELLLELKSYGFKVFQETIEANNDNSLEDNTSKSNDTYLEKGYDYLLGMKIWSLTQEKVQELSKQRDEKNQELKILSSKSAEDLWIEDLDALEIALTEFEDDLELADKHESSARQKANRLAKKPLAMIKPASKPKIIKKYSSDDEDDEDDLDDFIDDEDEDFEEEKQKPKKTLAPKPVVSKPTTGTTTNTSTSSKPIAKETKPVAVVKPVASESIKPVVKPISLINAPVVVQEVETSNAPMSLFERLKAKNTQAAASILSATTTILPSKSTFTSDTLSSIPSKQSKPVKEKAPVIPKQSKKVICLSDTSDLDNDDESDFEEEKVSKKSKGIKRSKKVPTNTSEAHYSPGAITPKVVKKTKKVEKVIPVAQSKPKKVTSKKEEDDDDDMIKRTPKPSRARKVTNYATYYEDEGFSEDEEDSFIGDDDDEEEEDFSDYE